MMPCKYSPSEEIPTPSPRAPVSTNLVQHPTTKSLDLDSIVEHIDA